MKEILEKLFKSAIKLNDIEYNSEQIQSEWLGNLPASDNQITAAEERLNIKLPSDYKEILLIANGFSAPNSIEPCFLPVEQINFFKHSYQDVIEAFDVDGIEDVTDNLKRSILVAKLDEEQYFLLIPPHKENRIWKYWKFADWIPGEEEYTGIEDYLQQVINFNLTELNQID